MWDTLYYTPERANSPGGGGGFFPPISCLHDGRYGVWSLKATLIAQVSRPDVLLQSATAGLGTVERLAFRGLSKNAYRGSDDFDCRIS